MSVHELLSQIAALGIKLWLDDGGVLRYRAPKGAMTDAVAQQLREHRGAVVEWLKTAVDQGPQRQSGADDSGATLSFAQRRLWVTQQMDRGSAAYNVPLRLRLFGQVDVGALARAFERVVDRHQVLRTVYATVDDEPVAVVQPSAAWSLMCLDLRQEADPAAALERHLAAEAARPFDLAIGPLMRTVMYQDADDSRVLAVTVHHIVIDADSASLLIAEVMAFYQGLVTGLPVRVPELPVQYGDFAAWQKRFLDSPELAVQLNYWKGQLAQAPAQASLPTDYPRGSDATAKARAFSFLVDEAIQRKVRAVCRDGSYTPFMVLLAAYQLVMARYGNTDAVYVGVPVAGRTHARVEHLIGCFLNGLILVGKPAAHLTVAQFLDQVRATTLDGFDHQEVPLDLVVEAVATPRDARRSSLFQVGFSYREHVDLQRAINAVTGDRPGAMRVEYLPLVDTEAKYDLILGFSEADSRLEGTVEYRLDLFSAQTIADFAACFCFVLEQMVADPQRRLADIALFSEQDLGARLGLDVAEVEAVQPLSPPQRDVWLDQVRAPHGLQNCLGWAARLPVALDPGRWRQAVVRVVAQHRILRARIKSSSQPFLALAYQVVYRPGVDDISFVDITLRSADEAALRELLDTHIYRPVDVSSEPLVRYGLVRIGDDESVPFIAAHHLALDGQGLAELMSRMCEEYDRLADQDADVASVAGDVYGDYLRLAHSSFDQPQSLQYWRERTEHCEALDFSALGSVPVEVEAGAAAHQALAIPPAHDTAVRHLIRANGVTPALYWKVVYALTVGLYAGARADFVIHEVISGRPRGHQKGIGSYFGQVPFVVPAAIFCPARHVSELLKHAIEDRRSRAEHEHVTQFAQAQMLAVGAVNCIFNYYNFSAEHTVAGAAGPALHFPPPVTNELALVVKNRAQRTELSLQYPAGVVDGREFLERMLTVSSALIAGDGRIDANVFLTAEEHGRIEQLARGARSAPSQPDMVAVLREGLSRHADRVAVIDGDDQLTAAELDRQSTLFAFGLMSIGIAPGEPVAILLEPGIEFMVAVYGTIKAGLPYIPVDTSYPRSRIEHLLHDAGCTVCVASAAVPGSSCAGTTHGVGELVMRGAAARERQLPRIAPEQCLYILYTSGSTGKPKGASVSHAGAVNLLDWYTRELSIVPGDRALLASSIGFDLTQKNLFAFPAAGGTLVVAGKSVPIGQQLVQAVAARQISFINCAPSVLYSGIESGAQLAGLSSLKAVVLGGEEINVRRLADWTQRDDNRCRVINSYGPTECTDVVSSFDLGVRAEGCAQSPPIGRPIPNVSLSVLDRGRRLLPPGFVGELAIGGVSVGMGYRGDAALSEARFVPGPLDGGTIYLTGDRVKWSADGELLFRGRVDFQVKVRGMRLEPAEVETALRNLVEVIDALVVGAKDRLIAYVVTAAAAPPPGWRDRLAQDLPAHMVPDVLIPLPGWPLTPNGKIDRKALPGPEPYGRSGAAREPADAIEAAVLGIFGEVLGVADVTVEDNFFALGGQSLLAVQLAARICRQFNIELTARALFERATAADLAAHVRELLTHDKLLWVQRGAEQSATEGYEDLVF